MSLGLIEGFLKSWSRSPDAPALWVDGVTYTYAELGARAARVAAAIRSVDDPSPFVAVYAQRSLDAYAGVLGVLAAGKGYVPLSPRHPAARTRAALALSGVRTVVCDADRREAVVELVDSLPGTFALIAPEFFHAPLKRHSTLDASAFPAEPVSPSVDDEAIAYLMFTSGSTGSPKGVPVSHANARAYVRHAAAYYGSVPGDVHSQNFELTFDLSVHDMFVCWHGGAELACIPEAALLAPARFIQERGVTHWFSVPSSAATMGRLRLLRPGAFPTLRWSLFCGEALPAEVAALWHAAAPNSILENLYGPTEATVAITRYRWDPERSPEHCVGGIVPIGWSFPGQEALLLGENGVHDVGELYLSGSQVVRGYFNDEERSRASFLSLPGRRGTWYRTGDLVTRGPDGMLKFLGRVDNQVKVRGHRVELEEIECVAREAGAAVPVAVAWPRGSAGAEGIVLFAESPTDEGAILARCRERLPSYQVPRRIVALPSIPRNANGKTDRTALARLLEETDGPTT